ncbi:MAG: caspase family protein [Planctomycetota bacterium]
MPALLRPATLLVFLISTLAVYAQPAADTRPAAPESGGNSYALLIGCTEYPVLKKKYTAATYENVIRLVGPAHDCELLRDTLMTVLGYPAANVSILSGWPDDASKRPTRKNILGGLDALAKRVVAGDRVFILLAGHGTQTRDRAGDELDGLDEVFLPADVSRYEAKRGRLPGAISDDEIGRRVAAIRTKGAFVWIVMDCCHSGTMVRGADPEMRVRYLSPEILGVPAADQAAASSAHSRRDGQDLEPAPVDGYVAMYAAQSYRKAPEMRLPRGDANGRSHGLFSFMLARAIARTGGRLTYSDLQAQILAGYQALPYENAVPLAEGEVERRIVGDVGDQATESLRLHMDRSGSIYLNAGQLWGIAAGTRLSVHPLGQSDAPALGFVRVADVELVRARCEVIVGDDVPALSLPELDPLTAVVQERPVGELALPVAVVDNQLSPLARDKAPTEVAEFLERSSEQFPWVATPNAAEWLIVVADGLYLQALHTAAAQRYPIPSGDLERELRRLFKVRNLKRLVSEHLEPPSDGLEVHMRRVSRGKSHPLIAGEVLHPGDEIEIEAINRSGRIYDLTILLLDAQHGVQAIFPQGGATARLTPQDKKRSWRTTGRVDDKTLGLEHLLVLAIPRTEQSDVVNFTWLQHDPLALKVRGGSDRSSGPLGQVLDSLAFGSSLRGLQIKKAQNHEAFGRLISWRTEWPALKSVSFPKKTIEIPRLRGARPAASAAVPAPWDGVGARVARSSTHARGKSPDLLLIGGEVPTHVLVDVDGDHVDRGLTPEDLTTLVQERSFDAELILRFDGTRRLAFYDTNNDGEHDLILEDNNEDMSAEIHHAKRGGTWHTVSSYEVPWLWTEHFGAWHRKHKSAVILKLNKLLREESR